MWDELTTRGVNTGGKCIAGITFSVGDLEDENIRKHMNIIAVDVSYKAHRALTHTSALFTFLLARNARADTSARRIGFCVIWVCISSSSSLTSLISP